MFYLGRNSESGYSSEPRCDDRMYSILWVRTSLRSSFSIYIPREASPGCIRIRRGFSQSSKIPAQPHQHLILILRLCLCRKPHPPPLLIFQLGNVLSAVPACCTITGSQFFNMKLIELRSRDTCTMSGTTIVPHLLL
ncbi:unnamed protein product [Somion occarium]|uniref:Uncharacterized protein n=1 Tax=Somion occarium TaxID=3059160 RepID=A0ABP1DUT8_9APHY